MRALALAAVLVVVCVVAVAGSAADREDVHLMARRHLNALPTYYRMAQQKVAQAQQTGADRHLLLQTCARMTEERDGELAQFKDFNDILPAACTKYFDSHGIKVIELDTCPNATQNSGAITGLGNGACCDRDSQCTSGSCDRSTRTCTLACDIEATVDSCASHQGGWSDESYCEIISGDPSPPADCTFCHMSYECGNLGSVDNFCMACPTYIGNVTTNLLASANCLEENSIDDFLATQNDDGAVFTNNTCVASPGWEVELTCNHGYLYECVYPALENLNILLGEDCLNFPCGLADLEYIQSEYDFRCAGNGNGQYCSAIMKCALEGEADPNVDNCTYATQAGCCVNTWATYWEANGNQTLVNMILDLEADCSLDNSSSTICDPCYGLTCEEYVEVEEDEYDWDTSPDDLEPYAATLIALFCIVFLCILFFVFALAKGLCPCCPSGDGGKQQQQRGGEGAAGSSEMQPRGRAASPKQGAAGGEGFASVATTEPGAPAPARGAVVPQMDEQTNAPTHV